MTDGWTSLRQLQVSFVCDMPGVRSEWSSSKPGVAQSGTCARVGSTVLGVGWCSKAGSPWGQSLWETCRSGLWGPPGQEGLAMVFSSRLLLSYTRTHCSKGKGAAWSQAPPPARPGSQGLAEPAGELESLLPSHQRTPTWVRGRSQRKPSSSFLLPHTLLARAVSALRTVIWTGTSHSLAEYWHSAVTWGLSFPSSELTDAI